MISAPRPTAIRLAGLLAYLAIIPASALADTVWMKNGDRLSGTVRSLGNGKLVMDTTYGGTLSLNWNAVSTLSSEQVIEVHSGTSRQVSKAQLMAADPGYIMVKRGEDVQRVQVAKLEEFIKPKPKTDTLNWTGNIDVGVNLKKNSGQSQDYHFAYNNKINVGKWRNDFGGTWNRDKEDGTMDSENYSLRYALDYMFRDQYFWQGRARYKRDWVEDLSQQAVIGTGPGYQFWDDKLGSFSLAILGGAFTYGYSDSSSASHFGALVRWDYQRYLQGRKVVLFTQGDVGHSLDEDGIFTLDAEIGLRYKLTNWSSLNITYGHNLVSGTRESLNERDFTTGLGVKW